MNEAIRKNLEGYLGYNIFPFMWVHGESEERYREVLRVIKNASINAVCIEARPHKEFCKDNWWRDMDIIVDECKKLGMEIWILDDEHFPTGYAAGKCKEAPNELRRIQIALSEFKAKDSNKVDLKKYFKIKQVFMNRITDMMQKNKTMVFDDDRLLGAYAKRLENGKVVERIALKDHINGTVLNWKKPAGEWTVEVVFASRNMGWARSYINMMCYDSCRIQIDAVYEPHYQHYKEEFGKTIKGFFSDEPFIGNGYMYRPDMRFGKMDDLPWSDEVEQELKKLWGEDFASRLPMLWTSEYDETLTADTRYDFMNVVSRLVEKDFSKQIGDWCKEHNVEYIGHLIEDEGGHARTGQGLGHYFRGLSGQHMAGIDNIGGQIEMYHEDNSDRIPSLAHKFMGKGVDGEFYHYELGKLGSSMAELQPEKLGRAMCENFGNYGWSEGIRLEKYLSDHLLVRGINRFVPHAFTCKDFPERDCPPHFWAQGHNPQYRHFGELMKYVGRLTNVFSDGKNLSDIAVLYTAEGDWTDDDYMPLKYVGKTLYDEQIDYIFMPTDVFEESERYNTELSDKFTVNGKQIRLLVVPKTKYVSKYLYDNLDALKAAGCDVVFVNEAPVGVINAGKVEKELKVVELSALPKYVEDSGLKQFTLTPKNDRVRIMRYKTDSEMFFIVNEGRETFDGEITLPGEYKLYEYDAYENKCYKVNAKVEDGKTVITLNMPTLHARLFVDGECDGLEERLAVSGTPESLDDFAIYACPELEYPTLKKIADSKPLCWSYSDMNPKFSGIVAYEKSVDLSGKTALEITSANEGVEVFVNGESLGIQITAPFTYDVRAFDGVCDVRIEVASTLERDRAANKKACANMPKVGITGKVNLY